MEREQPMLPIVSVDGNLFLLRKKRKKGALEKVCFWNEARSAILPRRRKGEMGLRFQPSPFQEENQNLLRARLIGEKVGGFLSFYVTQRPRQED